MPRADPRFDSSMLPRAARCLLNAAEPGALHGKRDDSGGLGQGPVDIVCRAGENRVRQRYALKERSRPHRIWRRARPPIDAAPS